MTHRLFSACLRPTACSARLLALLSVTALLLPLESTGTAVGRLPEKPNILLIVSDDHGYADMSWKGIVPDVDTPNLDRLRSESTFFTNGYVTAPICTPSRIGILLGAHQQRYGNWWYSGPGIPGPEVPTIAEVMKSAGYRTAMIGKTHFNARFDPEARNHPLNHGFDRFYGFNGPAKHYLVHNAERERVFLEKLMAHSPQNKGYPMMFYGPMWDDYRQIDVEGFSTDLFRDAAINFMETADEHPFFVMLSFNAVHDQTYQLPEEYLRANNIPLPRNWDPSLESLQEWSRDTYSRTLNRAYILGQLHFMDLAIGRILDHLEATDQRENTVIVYIADNGGSTPTGCINTPLRGGKFEMFEGGLKVPFFVSYPSVFPEDATNENVVSALDFLPTFAALAGAKVPATAEGINLVPLLTGADPELHHETLIWDEGHRWAVRKGDWKLHYGEPTRRGDSIDENVGYRLTNLKWDPAESQNLIIEHADKAAELATIHRDWLEGILRKAH